MNIKSVYFELLKFNMDKKYHYINTWKSLQGIITHKTKKMPMKLRPGNSTECI